MTVRSTRRARRRTRVPSRLLTAALAVGALAWPSWPVVAVPSSVSVATREAAMERRLDAGVARIFDSSRVAGLSVAVSERGRVVVSKGYGLANLQRHTATTGDTIYRTGSIGKQFTAAAVLRLAEQGRLSLDDPVARFLRTTPSVGALTLRQLLSHTGGLPDVEEIPEFASSQGLGMTLPRVVDLIGRERLRSEPGTRFSYSNSGYLLAGAVIQAVTGRPAASFVMDDVVRRAGLRDVSTCSLPAVGDRIARGYDRQDGKGWSRALRLGRPPTLVPARAINLEIVSSAGGFCSTAKDLVRWADALHTGRVIDRRSVRQMTEPTTLADGSRVPYGLAVQHRKFGRYRALSHGGVIWGFNAMLAHFPKDGVSVALMMNTLVPEQSEAEQVWTTILGAVFDESPASGWREIVGEGR